MERKKPEFLSDEMWESFHSSKVFPLIETDAEFAFAVYWFVTGHHAGEMRALKEIEQRAMELFGPRVAESEVN